MRRRAVVRFVCILLLAGAILFVSAGRINLPFFWLYFGVEALGWTLLVANVNPALLNERLVPGPGGVDRLLRAQVTVILSIHLVVAGLDAGRFEWSHVALPMQVAALVGFSLAFAFTAWAVHINAFFSPVVRIQYERGHQLVTGGPYRFVRHPGYLGVVAALLLSGPSLGSWFALVPNFLAVALVLRRAALEDRFLHSHLDGYADYSHRVRFRILPGLW